MFTKTAQQNGASKPSGMDMMIQSLLRGMGVSPDALTGYIEQGKQLATQFVAAMQNTSARLDSLETELKEIKARQIAEEFAAGQRYADLTRQGATWNPKP
jgi:hypothetical protein